MQGDRGEGAPGAVGGGGAVPASRPPWQSTVMEGIARIFRVALTCETEEELGRACLAVAEAATGSRFGFIAEINLATHRLDEIAISDPGWDACRMREKDGHGYKIPVALEIHGLYGRVLRDGKTLVANDPASHPDRIGTPPGHPPIRAFLGVPLVEAGRTIGMIGLGNRDAGYGPDDVEAAEMLAPAVVQAFQRKRAEAALRRSEESARRRAIELEAVLDAVPAAVFITRDRDARTMTANRVGSEVLRVPSGANISKSAPEGEAPRSFRATRNGVDVPPEELPVQVAASSGREVRGYEFDLVFEDGSVRHLLGNATPLRGPDGEPAGAVGAFLDLTDRKHVEEELARTLENVGDAFFALDAEWRFVYVNAVAERMLRVRRGEVLGRSHWDVFPLIVGTLAEAEYRRAAGGEVREFESFYEAWQRWLHATCYPRAGGGMSVFIRDVTVRKQQERELQDANARLVEADRRKDEFLGMLSHELRNPLAPIQNALYVLDNAEPEGPAARRAREVMKRQVGHLTRLVDDLLDVTRIARGKIELRRVDVDAAELVRRTGEDHRSLMQRRGIDFSVEAPSAPVRVTGDETRLAQIVGNLLHNAAKFTPSGGRVILSAAVAGERAVIRVRDTGAGIDPELLARVFEPFTQGEQTLARSEGGLGLGLALVKGLVELHGGTVEAASAGRGRGTEMTVRLPVVREASAPAQERARAVPAAGSRRRVLVVDDNRDAAESLAEVVRILGHAAEVVLDGPSAVALARRTEPDVVLCDLGLPGMSGYDVARALRSGGPSGIQLVAVSGYAQPEDLRAASEAGFDRHIAKPADPAEIQRLLDGSGPT